RVLRKVQVLPRLLPATGQLRKAGQDHLSWCRHFWPRLVAGRDREHLEGVSHQQAEADPTRRASHPGATRRSEYFGSGPVAPVQQRYGSQVSGGRAAGVSRHGSAWQQPASFCLLSSVGDRTADDLRKRPADATLASRTTEAADQWATQVQALVARRLSSAFPA